MTTDLKAFGRRVARFRKDRGFDQRDLAARLDRSASWVSQVERGVIPVRRLDLLRDLAAELGVALQQLEPTIPAGDAEASTSELNDLDGARLLISGHPVLDTLLPEPGREAAPSETLESLTAQTDEAWRLAHTSQFADLTLLLQNLVPSLERSCRAHRGTEHHAELLRLLARTYQALAAGFTRQDEADAAWVAADRAIGAAEASGSPLDVCAGIYRLAQAFVRLRHLDQAEHAASTALETLFRHLEDRGPTPEESSVMGSLHLVLALVHARGGQRAEARADITAAREIAANISDRNDFNLEFGPTNVEIQAVAMAVELGDAGEAVDVGTQVQAGSLSNERRARLAMDLGRAYVQRRETGEALACLLEAEELAPEMIHSHTAARAAIRELVLINGESVPHKLRDLASRSDAMG